MTAQLPTAGAQYNQNAANQTNARVNTRLTNAEGVTGALQTLTNNGIMIGQSGNNMTPKNPTTISVGATGQFLVGNTSAAPSWYSASWLTTPGTIGQVLVGGSSAPQWITAGTNGQLLIGQTGAVPAFTTVGSDGTISASGSLIVTKTNGTSFAPSATTDTTSATNITSGTLQQSLFGVADQSLGSGINNIQITTSVGSNILTVNLVTASGSNASASNPINVVFRDVTVANGDPTMVSITSALNMTTNAAGASLGTASSNVPFKIWVLVFNNAGTAVLALWQSVTGGSAPTAIAALDESTVQSTTGISGSATAAGTFYTPNGTSLSNCAFRILGWMEWNTGLSTAGNYASSPTEIQLYGSAVKIPMDCVQGKITILSTNDTSTSATYVAATNARLAITPTRASHVIRCMYSGVAADGTASQAMNARFSRGTSNNTNMIGSEVQAGNTTYGQSITAWDAPGTTSSTTYCVQTKSTSGSTANLGNSEPAIIELMEFAT